MISFFTLEMSGIHNTIKTYMLVPGNS